MGRGVGVTLITEPTLYTGQISRTGQDKEVLAGYSKVQPDILMPPPDETAASLPLNIYSIVHP